MSRTVSEGLQFTRIDNDIFYDRKIKKLCRLCDENAPMVYIGLLCLIGKENYYIDWNEDTVFDVADMLHKEEEYITRAVDACIKAGLFSKEMYEQYHILTSHGIQQQYNLVKALAKSKACVTKYSLLNKGITSEEKPISSEEKRITSEEMQQNKEKERKEKKSNSYYSSTEDKEEEKKEKLFIVSDFFFRGYVNPSQEYEELRSYNSRPGAQGWNSYSWQEKVAAAKLWKQKPQQPSKLPKDFLSAWKQVCKTFQSLQAPLDVRLAAVSDNIDIVISKTGKALELTVPDIVRNYIEETEVGDTHVLELIRPSIWDYLTRNGCDKLFYKSCVP